MKTSFFFLSSFFSTRHLNLCMFVGESNIPIDNLTNLSGWKTYINIALTTINNIKQKFHHPSWTRTSTNQIPRGSNIKKKFIWNIFVYMVRHNVCLLAFTCVPDHCHLFSMLNTIDGKEYSYRKLVEVPNFSSNSKVNKDRGSPILELTQQ